MFLFWFFQFTGLSWLLFLDGMNKYTENMSIAF
jgi:hypothetical protein